MLVEVDVRVAQQGGEVVGRRPHARVLEVDPPQPAFVGHQVAAVEVAVAQHARPRRDLGGQAVEAVCDRRAVLHREVALAIGLEEVLPEEMQLPRELLEIEGDLEAQRALRRARGLPLEHDELVERLAVQLLLFRRACALPAGAGPATDPGPIPADGRTPIGAARSFCLQPGRRWCRQQRPGGIH